MAGKRNAQEDFGMLSQFVQWAELPAEEAEQFVKEIMTRRGHKPVVGWREGDGENNGGDQKPNNVLGINFGGAPKKDSGQNWQYGA